MATWLVFLLLHAVLQTGGTCHVATWLVFLLLHAVLQTGGTCHDIFFLINNRLGGLVRLNYVLSVFRM